MVNDTCIRTNYMYWRKGDLIKKNKKEKSSLVLCFIVAGDLKKMKDACFAYFKLGGECVSGPVGLLSV